MRVKKILLVCSGNTCRSSMAEGLARHLLEQKGLLDSVTVLSAGTAACAGHPATPEAVTALSEEGIDLSNHRAQALTPELIKVADLVLTMTGSHRQQVLRLVPAAAGKVHLLKKYAESCAGELETAESDWTYDILDPFGQPLEVYRQVAQELKNNLAIIINRLPQWDGGPEAGKLSPESDEGETLVEDSSGQ